MALYHMGLSQNRAFDSESVQYAHNELTVKKILVTAVNMCLYIQKSMHNNICRKRIVQCSNLIGFILQKNDFTFKST